MAPVATDFHLFQCYAHDDTRVAQCLMRRLKQHLDASNTRRFQVWSDRHILVGANWDDEIRAALARADAGLVLLSPAVLASAYVRRVELPRLLADSKVIPVGLRPIDFGTQLPDEVKPLQVHRYKTAAGVPLFYTEGTGQQKDAFALGLYQALVTHPGGQP